MGLKTNSRVKEVKGRISTKTIRNNSNKENNLKLKDLDINKRKKKKEEETIQKIITSSQENGK